MFLKGIFDQSSIPPVDVAELVNTFGSSPSFDPLFREFVSGFGATLELVEGDVLEIGQDYRVLVAGDYSTWGGGATAAIGDVFASTATTALTVGLRLEYVL